MCISEAEFKREFKLIMTALTMLIAVNGWMGVTMMSLASDNREQNVRIEALEHFRDRGDRFTKSDGLLLSRNITHTTQMLVDHIRKSDPVLRDLRDFMVEVKTRDVVGAPIDGMK